MFDEKDIYNHLKNGGSIEDLQKALENEISNVQDRIIKEKATELKAKEAKDKELKARKSAVAALKSYFTLVNKDIDEDTINQVLDFMKNIKITVATNKNPKGSIEGVWNNILNNIFPF